MVTLNIDDAKNEFDSLVRRCIKNNDIIRICSSNGNVVLISESNYNNIIESINMMRDKSVYHDIEEAVKTPTSKFKKESPLN